MAAIIPHYSTVGFYNTPVAKGLFGNLFIASVALNVPHLARFKPYFLCSISDLFHRKELWRIVVTKTIFLDIKDLICGAMLLYCFRIFERRYGSRKFASMLLATSALSILLEFAAITFFRIFNLDFFAGTDGFISSGPFGIVFPLFVNYYFEVPRVAHANLVGVPVTGKTLTYLLGLQMCSTSTATLLSSACGILAGLMYRFNVFWIQKWLRVPRFLAVLADRTLGRLLRSAPPQDGQYPMGATVEIQRQQQMEMLEQQMLMNIARESRFYNQMPQGRVQSNHANEIWNGVAQQLERPEIRRRHANVSFSDSEDGGNYSEAAVDTEPNISFVESQVEALMEMGFERQRVLQALRTSGNDIHVATNILLQDS